MACPLCGDLCTCSTADTSSGGRTTVLIDPDSLTAPAAVISAAYSEPIAVNQATPEFYRPADTTWRNEITSRVRDHRRRRGFDPDASLDLGFDAPVRDEVRAVRSRFATDNREPSTDHEVDSRQPIADSEASAPAPARPTPSRYERIAMKRREAQMESGVLIEFPRPPRGSESTSYDLFPDALAEPLPTVPRILEAEEEVPAAELNIGNTAYASIQLDSAHDVAEDLQEPVEIELPLQVAPLSPRVVSAMIDAGLVCTATALFILTVLLLAPFGPSAQAALMPEGKLAIAMGLSLPVLFWAAYHYLFLVYAGITPGMQMAQVELSSFEGCFPTRPTRAARAAALLLSCLSLGMGFFWSLFDEDSLGWHDRITRTYLRQS